MDPKGHGYEVIVISSSLHILFAPWFLLTLSRWQEVNMEYDQLVKSPIERDRSNYVECLYFQSAACRFGDTVCSYPFCFDSPKTRVYSTFANLAFFFVSLEKDTKKNRRFEKKVTTQTANLSTFFSPAKIQGGGERPRWRFTLCTSKKYVQTSCCRPRAQWSIEGGAW